jgi:hypothetical protein
MGADKVHHWVPTTSGTATVKVVGDYWPASLYVKQGSCQGTEIACNYQTGQWPTETVTFSATAGTDYYIWLGDPNYQGQTVEIYTVTVTAP